MMTSISYNAICDTKSIDAYEKIMKVIESCSTDQQLKSAKKWGIYVMRKRFDNVCNILAFNSYECFNDSCDWFNNVINEIDNYVKK